MEAGPHMGFRGQMRLNCPFLFSPPKRNPTNILWRYVPDTYCQVQCINKGAMFQNSCKCIIALYGHISPEEKW